MGLLRKQPRAQQKARGSSYGTSNRVILAQGQHETVKAAIHGALGALAGVCLVYNVGVSLSPRRCVRHVANVGFYAIVIAWEVVMVMRHATDNTAT